GIFPHLSNRQRQVNLLQCSLKSLAIRRALPRASLNDLPVPVALHDPHPFKPWSISFFPPAWSPQGPARMSPRPNHRTNSFRRSQPHRPATRKTHGTRPQRLFRLLLKRISSRRLRRLFFLRRPLFRRHVRGKLFPRDL